MIKKRGYGKDLSIGKWCRNPGGKDTEHAVETSTGGLITRGRREGGGFKIKRTKVLVFEPEREQKRRSWRRERCQTNRRQLREWEQKERRERVRDGIRCSDERLQKPLSPLDVSLFYCVWKVKCSRCSLASAFHRNAEWNADISVNTEFH